MSKQSSSKDTNSTASESEAAATLDEKAEKRRFLEDATAEQSQDTTSEKEGLDKAFDGKIEPLDSIFELRLIETDQEVRSYNLVDWTVTSLSTT